MEKDMNTRIVIAALLVSTLGLQGCAAPPQAVSHDGLHRVSQAELDSVYLKPNASLERYTAIRLEPCTVAFKTNWQRQQNSGRHSGRARVTQKDMSAITNRLARACDRHFAQALAADPAYKVVEQGGDNNVLELRPSIIDLDFTAPDINRPAMTRTYTTSSGEMTLFLEAYDGASGEIIARIIDQQEDFTDMHLEWTNRATNMADANRYLRRWTRSLRESLDAARGR
jgi:hypothetical protein